VGGVAAAQESRREERWMLPKVVPQHQGQTLPAPTTADSGLAQERTEYFTQEPREPAAGKAPAVNVDPDKGFRLDFHDSDIRAVVDVVLGDILKLNYTVAPQVQGKITLRTGRPIQREALLSALEATLASVSAALVKQDGGYQVMPLEAAPQRVRGAYRVNPGERATPGFAVEIVPLRFVGAKEMQRVLEVFSPKGSVLQADETHNHLVIIGSGVDRDAMLRTIEGFDIDGMKGMNFAFYKLENLSPAQLMTELKEVFQPPIELIGSRVRLVPVDRIQTLLGIAPNRSDLRTLDGWVRRLDVAPMTGERKLFVYNVQNGKARELAGSLQLVMNGESAANTRTAPAAQSSGTRTDAAPTTAAPASGVRGGQSRVVANEENNSLLILGTDTEYRFLQDAIKKLDVLPRQVMIEAILAEVTLGDDLRYGVQWFFDSSGSQATFSTSSSGSVSPQFPGFSYIYNGATNSRVVINALQSRTNVKVLSAPRLAVLNNQKASLQVGDEVPILTQVSQGTAAPGSPIVSSIQMRDTGVMLEVTPRINENGNVILEVTQEVSDVTSTTSSGIDSPTIQRRSLRSVIATRDGATVALGGLIRETSSRLNSGVPILKDIPYVGNLFKSNSTLTRRTELIVLLVPHVMRDAEEARSVAEALINSVSAAAEVASHATPLLQKQAD
jgi:general secretion pathway protein D